MCYKTVAQHSSFFTCGHGSSYIRFLLSFSNRPLIYGHLYFYPCHCGDVLFANLHSNNSLSCRSQVRTLLTLHDKISFRTELLLINFNGITQIPLKMAIFWDVAMMIALMMMEAASTSETSVNFYQTTRRNNPQDSHLHTRRHENLKSH
jgi:hypothetical protein